MIVDCFRMAALLPVFDARLLTVLPCLHLARFGWVNGYPLGISLSFGHLSSFGILVSSPNPESCFIQK